MNKLKRLGIHLPMLLLFTIATVALRTAALFNDFNAKIGYFDGKLLIGIADGILLGAILILFSFIFISKKFNAVASFKGAATFIPSGIVASALLFLCFELLIATVHKAGTPFRLKNLFVTQNIIPLAAAVLAFVCVINFFVTVFYTDKENNTRALFGIFTVIFLALYASYLYFDTKLVLNSPNKIVDQMAFLFCALFFLFETRISLGREMWRAYCAFGLVASLVTAYSALPSIIYYFGRGKLISDSLAAIILCFAFFIYITVRVVQVNYLITDEKSKQTEALEALAKERAKKLECSDEDSDYNKSDNSNTVGENYEFDIKISERSPYESDNEDTQ